MYNSETEVIFPIHAIDNLKGLRGDVWDQLIERVLSTEVDSVEQLAFVLMVVKIVGCAGCNADSFRAMRGCVKCAQQSIRRFRGSDEDLVKQFQKAKQEIVSFHKKP